MTMVNSGLKGLINIGIRGLSPIITTNYENRRPQSMSEICRWSLIDLIHCHGAMSSLLIPDRR